MNTIVSSCENGWSANKNTDKIFFYNIQLHPVGSSFICQLTITMNFSQYTVYYSLLHFISHHFLSFLSSIAFLCVSTTDTHPCRAGCCFHGYKKLGGTPLSVRSLPPCRSPLGLAGNWSGDLWSMACASVHCTTTSKHAGEKLTIKNVQKQIHA